NGGFVEIGSTDDDSGHTYAVQGDGSYVDRTTLAQVGAEGIGKNPVGGGGDGIVAYNYFGEVPIRLANVYQVKIRFEAVSVGYVSVSRYSFFKILPMGQRVPAKYR